MTALIIGYGLIGSAVAQHIDEPYILSGIDWRDPSRAAIDVHDAVRMFLSQEDEFNTIYWCAGAGVVGTDPTALRYETSLVAAMTSAAGRVNKPVTISFVSSGGGVCGGHSDGCIGDSTPPAAISPYGVAKLEQENLVREWAHRVDGRAIIFRPSNVFGPRQNLSKPQGFISQALWRLMNHEPFVLTVPDETTRDFIYAGDVGHTIAWFTENAGHGVTVRTVASGQSIELGELILMMENITGQMMNISRMDGTAAGQPSHLRFCTDRSTTPLSLGIRFTWEQMLADNQLNTLEDM